MTAEESVDKKIAALTEKARQFILDGDDFAPREKRQRYRIYRVKDGGAPELVATCRTQGSVGVTLCTLGAEGEFLDYCVGVLDGMDHKDTKGEWVGKWLVLPWVAQPKENDNEHDDREAAGVASS